MGKTDTIKERRVDVYLDSLDRKERWTDLADDEDQSLSKFVQQCVEYAIQQGGPDFAELGKESKQIQELEDELTELRNDIKQKNIVIEKLESELKQLRAQSFLNDGFTGQRDYDQDLIEILQESDRITDDQLLQRLDIDPTRTELVKGIDTQLQQLERYGLVQSTTRGWMWTG